MPATVRLCDYSPPTHAFDDVQLHFDLADIVRVRACHTVRARAGDRLRLRGEFCTLEAIEVNGERWPYEQIDGGVELASLPETFALEVHTSFDPAQNTELMGLYQSQGMLCTQCEADGFRRISYSPDRPDVLSVYTVHITADPGRYPVLLSNGNHLGDTVLDDGRVRCTWHDPYPKPSYLFALVAGDLQCIEGKHTTGEGREVTLRIYSDAHSIEHCHFALDCLQSAMRWDEEHYGLHYDLDLFNVVAVSDFNIGAMENKSLNIFSSGCLLADPSFSTDARLQLIDRVVAHEYFHNYSGNRVTCRDWFQLSLKEGFTIYRESQYAASRFGEDNARLDDLHQVLDAQFPEDDGPLVHPVRPASYDSVQNLYSSTIYTKGGELIRMLHRMVGDEAYYRATALYFARFDGQAVTCEDFVACVEEAARLDLAQFFNWYTQAGRPHIALQTHYDAQQKTLTIDYRQAVVNKNVAAQKPFVVPMEFALLDAQSGIASFSHQGQRRRQSLVELDAQSGSFHLEGIEREPVLVPFINLSAPVSFDGPKDVDALALIYAKAPDAFSRINAAEALVAQALLDDNDRALARYVETHALLLQEEMAPQLRAKLLAMPSFAGITRGRQDIDVAALYPKVQSLRTQIATSQAERWQALYDKYHQQSHGKGYPEAAARQLMLHCLTQVSYNDQGAQARTLLAQADNITEQSGAISALYQADFDAAQRAMDDLYVTWSQNALSLNQWFALQAKASGSRGGEIMRELLRHEDYNLKNPTRALSLLMGYATGNPYAMWSQPQYFADLMQTGAQIDALNGSVSARLLSELASYARFHAPVREAMQAQFAWLNERQLSAEARDVVSKTLKSMA